MMGIGMMNMATGGAFGAVTNGSGPEYMKPQPVEHDEQKEEGVKCTNCGNVVTGNFCTNCGTKKPEQPQAKFCTNCGAKVNLDAKFCMECGTKL